MFIFEVCLFIFYFWLRWVFIALCGLLSSCFSVWRFLPLQSMGSRVWTQLLHGLFLEQGGIEHVSPAFAGWFFFVAHKEYWTYSFPFLRLFFNMDHFKHFSEFVTISLLFYVLDFWPWGMWNLSFLIRDQICLPCIERQNLNHWTTREVPLCYFQICQ